MRTAALAVLVGLSVASSAMADQGTPRLVPVPGNPFASPNETAALTGPAPGTAGAMLKICEMPESSEGGFACFMYMRGLLDGTVADRVLNRDPAFCVPRDQADVSPELAREIFKRWARSNPDYLDKDTGLAVLASLRQTYPCRRSNIVR